MMPQCGLSPWPGSFVLTRELQCVGLSRRIQTCREGTRRNRGKLPFPAEFFHNLINFFRSGRLLMVKAFRQVC